MAITSLRSVFELAVIFRDSISNIYRDNYCYFSTGVPKRTRNDSKFYLEFAHTFKMNNRANSSIFPNHFLKSFYTH